MAVGRLRAWGRRGMAEVQESATPATQTRRGRAMAAVRGWCPERIAWALILLGVALRLIGLGHIPPGLNSDEASAEFEAMALLQSGADRWGNPWPVYFPNWGSGMNVLYSYLSMPLLWWLGPGTLTIRLVNAVFGCLTLPLAWQVARRHGGPAVGLIATALLALLPWHVMLSRWALESNLLVFWFTLGLLTLGAALTPGAQPWRCAVALLPWAVGVYAYAAAVAPLAIAALILLAGHRRAIAARAGWWALGAALALVIDAPFLLFLVKNQVLHRELGIEAWLPFSVPLLPASRLAQAGGPLLVLFRRNTGFFVESWRDGLPWNHMAEFSPLSGLLPWLALVGMVEGVLALRRGARPSPVLAGALSLLGIFPLFLFNVNRINVFFVPAVILAAQVLVRLHAALRRSALRGAVVAATLLYLGGFAFAAQFNYFRWYGTELAAEEDAIHDVFRTGLREALGEAVAAAGPEETVLVDVLYNPYVWVLVFGFGDLDSFRATRRVELRGGTYHVLSFGRFVFERAALPPGRPFAFVMRAELQPPCAAPRPVRSDRAWVVGECPGGALR